jgi:hypothetical protein
MGNILAIAQHYTRSGWAVVPVGHRQKRPIDAAWQTLRIKEYDLPGFFNGHPQNIGVLLGDPSGGLVDIDLDCNEVLELAPVFLPGTPLTFGRVSKLRSHWLYRAPGAELERFVQVTHVQDGARKRKLVHTICELRSTGGQTVFPGSVHESGEPVEWSDDIPEAPLEDLLPTVSAVALRTAVCRMAGCVLLLREGYGRTQAIGLAMGDPAAVSGMAGEQLRSWLGEPGPEARAPATGNPEIDEAVRRWNGDHGREFPRNSAPCPVCQANASFGRLPRSPDRWACHSTKHPDDVGISGKDCMHGDVLDLEAFARGRSRVQVLREDGYLGPRLAVGAIGGNPGPATSQAPVAVGPKPIRIVNVIDEILAEAALPVMETGFAALDAALGGGFRARMIHTIIAGSGKGKTSLAVQMGARHAETAPVLYYSGELTRAQLAARLIGQRTGRSWRDVLLGRVSVDEMRTVLGPLQFDLLRGCAEPIKVIGQAADEMLSRRSGVPLIIVDYAQIVADLSAGPDPRFGVMLAIRQLAALVETRDMVLLLLSQGGRASARAMRTGEGHAEDYVDAGAETSDLEKFSSTVMALVYSSAEGTMTHEVTVMVAKQRLGGPAKVGLLFHGPSGQWMDLGRAPTSPATLRAQELERRVIDIVKRHPAHFTKTELRDTIGGKADVVAGVIQRLIDDGVFFLTPSIRDRRSGRRMPVSVISYKENA